MGRPPKHYSKGASRQNRLDWKRSSWTAPSINTSVKRSWLRRESKDREYEEAVANLKRLGIIPEDEDTK